MKSLENTPFVCLDCETTGLNPEKDRIIEFAAIKFTLSSQIDSLESLINPETPISPESEAIHKISFEMVQGKPLIIDLLPQIFSFVGNHLIVGHNIGFDIGMLRESAKRHNLPFPLEANSTIDTLRLARLYGESPTNSLEMLRKHFNIEGEGAHRAMNDVLVNIQVFKYLVKGFHSADEILKRLKDPILMRTMPLGKHKGSSFKDLPLHYIHWALKQEFDQDLIYSLEKERQRRQKHSSFSSNPFAGFDWTGKNE